MRLRTMRSKKLFVVLRNLIIAEVFVYLAFMALALSADWGMRYEGFVMARYVRFEIVEFLFLGLAQLSLIVLVFARSFNDETDVDEMLKTNVASHHKTLIPH